MGVLQCAYGNRDALGAGWERQDSLTLQLILDGIEEIRFNREALEELRMNFGMQQSDTYKPWLEYDTTLPDMPNDEETAQLRALLTLYPYKADTPYNWDPIYRRKIKVDKDTWRGDPFRKVKIGIAYSAKRNGVTKPSGLDFMKIFTKDFWKRETTRQRALTLKILRAYASNSARGWREYSKRQNMSNYK